MTFAADDESTYRALVVDSGPIIRRTALTSLWRKADKFYTVPAVMQEIRDAKAREHLNNLPFELIPREASSEGIQAVVNFARQTGDHHSLSAVDLQVLGLLYDLEREGCTDMEHIRRKPKRMVGVGKIKQMGDGKQSVEQGEYDVVEDGDDSDEEANSTLAEATSALTTKEEEQSAGPMGLPKPKTWAVLVNPLEASASLPQVPADAAKAADKSVQFSFGNINLQDDSEETPGQFSDAEDDTLADGEFNSSDEISDEECDVYIRDPEELDKTADKKIVDELKSEFPSLAAASTVPYEGSDDEQEEETNENEAKRKADEARKAASLKPVSKSGKLYNSFRKYGDLLKPKEVQKKAAVCSAEEEKKIEVEEEPEEDSSVKEARTRIIGGMTMAGQDIDVEDDGEGWITCTKDIKTMKAAGALDPKSNPNNLSDAAIAKGPKGPPISQRTACATTDFAMQNVILQMNLELLSVDGVKLRKLKSWVTRCGACFKVYTSSDNVGPMGTKRLFCERCGSDMMQRIAASVDGKTGRLRLHLSKKYKHNLRGTKFSLPKPGTGNRFQGDLLLREDQLLTGAWNQKVKMRSGGKSRKAAQSMFGRDIASNVGCNATAMGSDDIRVGFGRRNPNAAKGRERRGKKKKSSDKACGLRRY